MKTSFKSISKILATVAALSIIAMIIVSLPHCSPQSGKAISTGDAAGKIYIPPGKYDEFYEFLSGGFSGQVSVYGLPSCRLLKVIPVFALNAENGYGFTEESKPMLNSTHGFIPWDDSHHTELSMTD